MMRLLRLSCLAILVLLVLLTMTGAAPLSRGRRSTAERPEAAPASQGTTVLGLVTNGTQGGRVPSDLLVFLHVFSGMEETETHDTTVTADGSFRFDGLAIAEGETVVVRTVYQGVPYFSDLRTVVPGQQVYSLPITIYETTEGLADILITQIHVFVSETGDRLQVGEHYLVSNTGDRTCVGGEDSGTGRRTTLTFTLPDGARDLRFDGPGLGERFLERQGGFADTRPILPGSAAVEVFFRYDLPSRERLRVERVFDVPVESVVLVVPEDGVSLDGEGIIAAGALDTEMGTALSYSAGPLTAGEPVVFTVVAGPRASAVFGTRGVPSRNARAEIALGLMALAVAVVVNYLLLRSPTRQKGHSDSAPAPRLPPPRARPLVEAIAALDARFAAGDITEVTYRHRRNSLLSRLLGAISRPQADQRGHICDRNL